jgi:hypothetical protein
MNQKSGILFSFRCVAHVYSRYLCLQKKNKIDKYVMLLNIFATIFISSCNTQHSDSKEEYLPSNDSSFFYPVREYISTQLATADTIKNIYYSYSEDNIKKDSAIIDSEKLYQLVTPFLNDDINDLKIKRYYRETIFHDLSTASNTFTYTSVNNNLPLQTLDVLLDTVTNLVKRVDISKSFTKGDTLVDEKMWWRTNEGFSINRILQLPNKKETVQQINVSWGNN